MENENRKPENIEECVYRILRGAGYPSGSIVVEAKLDTRRFVDVLIIDLDTKLPLMYIEIKQCDNRNREMILKRAFDTLSKYGGSEKAAVKYVAAIYNRNKQIVEFVDFTNAVHSQNYEDAIFYYSLPSYETLRSGAKPKAITQKQDEQQERINTLRNICWKLIPALAALLLELDVLGYFELTQMRLIVLGTVAVILLIPCFKEISIGELSLKAELEKQEEDTK